MRTLLVVVTCPRQGASYVEETLDALDREGSELCEQRLILSDGEQPRLDRPGWSWLAFPGPSGTRRAFWRAFRLAHEMAAERLLLIEDDVRPCKNALARIVATEVPEQIAFLSFHDIRFCDPDAPYGLHEARLRFNGKTRDFCGNQCLLIPARSITHLVAHDPFSMPDDVFWKPRSSVDCVIGSLLNQSPWRTCAFHIPCLFTHVGEISKAHPGSKIEERAMPTNFPGLDFDALSLAESDFPFYPTEKL